MFFYELSALFKWNTFDYLMKLRIFVATFAFWITRTILRRYSVSLHLECSPNPFSSTSSKKTIGRRRCRARGKGAPRIVLDSPGTDDEGKFPKRFSRRNEPNSPERSFHGELDSKAAVTAGVNEYHHGGSSIVLQSVSLIGRYRVKFARVTLSRGRQRSRNRPLRRFKRSRWGEKMIVGITIPDVIFKIAFAPANVRSEAHDRLFANDESLAESRDARDRSP